MTQHNWDIVACYYCESDHHGTLFARQGYFKTLVGQQLHVTERGVYLLNVSDEITDFLR